MVADHLEVKGFVHLFYETLSRCVTLTCNSDHWYISWHWVTFIWLKWISIHQQTQNPSIHIPFHLYVRDKDLEQKFSSGRTCIYVQYWHAYIYIQLHLMTLGYLLSTQTLTQNLCFNIRFHLYIHDHVLDKPIATLTNRVNTYVPPI